LKIALIGYLATYAHAPLLARALVGRGHEVSLIVAMPDVYGFHTEYPSIVLQGAGRTGIEAARRAVGGADRLCLAAMPALTHVLPALYGDSPETTAFVRSKGGAILLTDSHLLRDPPEARRKIAEAGLRSLAMPDKMPYAPEGARPWWPPTALSMSAAKAPMPPCIVCHSPGKRSREEQKGTAIIEEAIHSVRPTVAVSYLPLRGLSHADALEARRSAHVFIDQVPEPMPVEDGRPPWRGGLGKSGLEALAAGCAVVSSGDALPPPVIHADRADLAETLARLVLDPAAVAEAGAAGRQWVNDHAAPDVAAEAVEEVLA